MNEQSKIQNKSITYNDLKFYIDVVGMLSWKQAKLVWSERTYHLIKEYFSKLTWDGKKRIDTLLKDA